MQDEIVAGAQRVTRLLRACAALGGFYRIFNDQSTARWSDA
jgi:hypothetical protein